jgi:hypothetical protein
MMHNGLYGVSSGHLVGIEGSHYFFVQTKEINSCSALSFPPFSDGCVGESELQLPR